MKYLKIIIISFICATLINAISIYMLQLNNVIGNVETDLKNLPYGLAIGLNLLLAFGTTPIFINLKARIKSGSIINAISFFLLPILITISVSISLGSEAVFGILSGLPYLAMLTVFYIRSKK